ncbi:MAG: hypothetical protein HOV81_14365 [Kofleriaceae bacterium]|nr:hypothetical protein [Kofleriaceae bacterium]
MLGTLGLLAGLGHDRQSIRVERLRRALRGVDRAEKPALPVGEAMHPVTLVAVVLLVVNDWILKSRFHGAVTGKLSDIAGLAFAPVVLTASIGLVLAGAARLGAKVDPSLTRRRLIGCIVATGAVFAAVKLSADAAAVLVRVLSALGRPAEIALDRTDLLTLPALAIAYWIGRDELRRVPLGKAAAIHRLGRAAGPALADSAWAGRDTAELANAIDAWDVRRVDELIEAE